MAEATFVPELWAEYLRVNAEYDAAVDAARLLRDQADRASYHAHTLRKNQEAAYFAWQEGHLAALKERS